MLDTETEPLSYSLVQGMGEMVKFVHQDDAEKKSVNAKVKEKDPASFI